MPPLSIEDVIKLRREDVERALDEQFGSIRQRTATRLSQLGRLRSPARETNLEPIDRAEFAARGSALTGLEGQYFDARANERQLDLQREELALRREMFDFERDALAKARKSKKRTAIGSAIGGVAGAFIPGLGPVAGGLAGGGLAEAFGGF